MLLLLIGAGVSLSLPVFMKGQDVALQLMYSLAVRGLLGLVLLFSTYAIYQQILIKRFRCELVGYFEMAAALSDALTGLANRALFLDRLGGALKRRIRHPDYLFAVLFLDLDRFKMVNDSLGHNIGDELLRAVAQRLDKCLRSPDTVARLGRDEFTMFLEDINDETDATRVAERIHKELRTPFQVDGHEVFTTSSIGIALSSTGYTQPEDLLRDADLARSRGGREVDTTEHSPLKNGISRVSLTSAFSRAESMSATAPC